jgi:hypothetical protein
MIKAEGYILRCFEDYSSCQYSQGVENLDQGQVEKDTEWVIPLVLLFLDVQN